MFSALMSIASFGLPSWRICCPYGPCHIGCECALPSYYISQWMMLVIPLTISRVVILCILFSNNLSKHIPIPCIIDDTITNRSTTDKPMALPHNLRGRMHFVMIVLQPALRLVC
ncbi:hypothetical protein CY34DRAFT_414712 [Suillus luteus UH-Slu-Lm8-n1]|uniref:Uncharacterized protein n=1 Tax=Suillus luteus UH-Slu-Lm8-n1 TaxID=930992 RepID=A0A0D0A8N3_9AGAM|nr:hypothetical protein CY34DRAFT_414712 [Suillus luteus UH-Slu-Lm8-n1]